MNTPKRDLSILENYGEINPVFHDDDYAYFWDPWPDNNYITGYHTLFYKTEAEAYKALWDMIEGCLREHCNVTT